MLFSLLSGGDIKNIIISLLLSLPVIILALSLHEAAHGYIADKMGDPTARNLGRLTLNPFKHIDPMGTLCMIIFGYGWAKPVPINTRNFRDPKRGMALSALAGPVMNGILGVIGAVLYAVFEVWFLKLAYSGNQSFAVTVTEVVAIFFYLWAVYNFMFMVFNLIPLPPFDGSRIFLSFLPADKYFAIMKYERYIMLGLLAVLMVTSNLFDFSPFSWVAEWLTSVISNGVAQVLFPIFF